MFFPNLQIIIWKISFNNNQLGITVNFIMFKKKLFLNNLQWLLNDFTNNSKFLRVIYSWHWKNFSKFIWHYRFFTKHASTPARTTTKLTQKLGFFDASVTQKGKPSEIKCSCKSGFCNLLFTFKVKKRHFWVKFSFLYKIIKI